MTSSTLFVAIAVAAALIATSFANDLPPEVYKTVSFGDMGEEFGERCRDRCMDLDHAREGACDLVGEVIEEMFTEFRDVLRGEFGPRHADKGKEVLQMFQQEERWIQHALKTGEELADIALGARVGDHELLATDMKKRSLPWFAHLLREIGGDENNVALKRLERMEKEEKERIERILRPKRPIKYRDEDEE